MRWKYSIAIGLIALLSLTAYLMLRQAISTQHGNAAKINQSGRQRMLSQRAAFFSSLLVLNPPLQNRDQIRASLKSTTDLFERSQESLGIRGSSSELNHEACAFVANIRSLLATPDPRLSPELAAYQNIRTAAAGTLLQRLDGFVGQVQQESEDQVLLLEKLAGIGLALTLLLLLLETVFIFKPMYAQMIRAEESAKMAALGQMAGAIGHEILNPIANISLSADWLIAQLKHPPLNPRQLQSGIDKIRTGVQRINKIITGLRHFAHPSESEPTQLSRIKNMIDETIDFSAPRFRTGRVELRVKPFRDDLAIPIKQVQISQVLLNLLNNAYDAVYPLKADRWIEIQVHETEDEVTIEVINGGPLISEEIKEKIWSGFYTTKSPEQGTGLGLTISKRIINEHRGRLWIKSGVPHTTFAVMLPKGKEHSDAE